MSGRAAYASGADVYLGANEAANLLGAWRQLGSDVQITTPGGGYGYGQGHGRHHHHRGHRWGQPGNYGYSNPPQAPYYTRPQAPAPYYGGYQAPY